MMPHRRRTRAENRTNYIAAERRQNHRALETRQAATQVASCGPPPPDGDPDPPPF